MDDLKRTVGQGYARAYCAHPGCSFTVDGVWPETASARARKHTRETGHMTTVRYEHTTEYRQRAASGPGRGQP